QLGDSLAALYLHEQDPPARGRQSKCQRGGYRRLAGAPLAGDDVQPHALPVAVTSSHRHQAILAPAPLRPSRSARGRPRAALARRGRKRWHATGLSLGWITQKAAALAARSGRKGVFPMLAALLTVLIILVVTGLTLVGRSLRVVQQYERGLIFRFGKVLPETRGPGLTIIRPIGDRLQKVNMQIVAMAVPAQEGITRDNVSVRVDAVVYFRVVDPIKAVINVQNYMFAVSQQAQTSLRSIIGQSEMDQLLAERESV